MTHSPRYTPPCSTRPSFGGPCWLGGVYVLLRAAYPLMLGKRVSKIQTKRVGFVTIPAYLLIFGMLGVAVASAFGG